MRRVAARVVSVLVRALKKMLLVSRRWLLRRHVALPNLVDLDLELASEEVEPKFRRGLFADEKRPYFTLQLSRVLDLHFTIEFLSLFIFSTSVEIGYSL